MKYHVGIRTVKDVLAALREEGLIRTEERKTAVVLYRPRRTSDENSILSYVLERRTSPRNFFQTIALLMPPCFPLPQSAAPRSSWNITNLSGSISKRKRR
ncbi:MAG: hypothetical protein ACLUOI_31220 [Eisenbergiella sp.]